MYRMCVIVVSRHLQATFPVAEGKALAFPSGRQVVLGLHQRLYDGVLYFTRSNFLVATKLPASIRQK